MSVQLARRKALGLMLAGGAAWLCGSRQARASVAVGITLPELLTRSKVVAFSQSLEAWSRWEDLGGPRRIVTYHRALLDEVVAGEPESSEVMVRTLGGTVGEIAQIVHGEAQLVRGEPCLLFLSSVSDGVYRVTELAQGHFPLKDDGKGTRRLRPSPRLGTLLRPEGSAVKALIGRSRPDALGLIREVRSGK